ncbi:MAG: hypothetical protein HYR56_33275 [Acidobacteria bacterium]|nr:hypothetical protein [Acidobacteriota bacterium]MBI3422405.1 hypothetical protein [Acidobacteriota bacterium]
MTKIRFCKFLFLLSALALFASQAGALPDYLKLYNADPFAKADLKGKCGTCHLNPAGGGPRNDFGKAFAQAGHQFTAELRQQFPDRFASGQDTPPVTFTSDNEAVVEINGKRYTINTRAKTVQEVSTETKPAVIAQAPKPAPTPEPKKSDVYEAVDVRVINLPSAIPIPKGSLWTDFTHRFPFGDPTDHAGLFGLDSIALPSFGFVYGINDHIHVGAYRSPGGMGRPIELYAGAQLLQESKGHPLSLQARFGVEGRDNFQRNFATSFEFTLARSITRHAQVYFVPTITLGDRPYTVSSTRNEQGETAVALGAGAAVNIRPSVALMAEANYRVNEAARYAPPGSFTGIHRPVVGFAIQKASATRRHSFTLTFTNGPGTTFSERSQTRGLVGADDSLQGFTIGFNLSRRLF